MQRILVKELMIPLEDYATVDENDTFYDAVLALEQARKRFDQRRPEHRAVLVLNKDRHFVGKIGYFDLLQGLEPKYAEVDELRHTMSTFTPGFIKSLLQKYNVWQKPLDDICRKAARVRVKDMMSTPGRSERIAEDATLDEAVHQLIVERHQSLLVTRDEEVVGILRLSDVVERVCEMIKACEWSSPEAESAGRA